MSEHPNAKRLRGLFEAFSARDVATIADSLAPDAVWHFPGKRGALAGTHAGHAGIFAFLARVGELTNGTFEIDLEAILADEGFAVVFFRGRGSRLDRVLDNPTCLKIRFRDGLAAEFWEFVWDLDAVEEFWS
jgi:ketosteroid isomerase-like protein